MSEPGREGFLARVRQAVQAGNRAGEVPPLPDRGSCGYQGAGSDPVARFCQEFGAAGGVCHIVANVQTATATLLEILIARGCQRVLLGAGRVLDPLDLANVLVSRRLEVVRVEDLRPTRSRDAFFAADAGITSVEHLIAETGSLVVATTAATTRSESLLPPLHIVVANQNQVLADLFDVFPPDTPMPSCLTIITGPSKTGDIELRLVTGVHGPGEVHLILIAGTNVPSPRTNND
jgi:L-lactate utilization protein LutC